MSLGVVTRHSFGSFVLDVEVEVGAGECLAVAGPSGAGKTTLLRIVAGLLRPAGSRVSCGGTDWSALPPEQRRVAFLFQEHALFPTMSAWRNVAFALRGGDRRARAVALLERFAVAERADARPSELSGGERQRVALARALAREPEAILLDEPLSSLDATSRGRAARVIAETLADLGVPALLVTHDFTEAAELGDRVAVLDAGRIVQTGSASELAASPVSAFVADFAGANVLHGVARAGADGLTEVELDGGGLLASTDQASGLVWVSVFPWEISLELRDAALSGSARNRLPLTVRTVTVLGARARVGLGGAQPLAAEITAASAQQLRLAAGVEIVAVFKAAATRLLPR